MTAMRFSPIASLALAAGLVAAAMPAQARPASVDDRISAAVARAMDYPRELEPGGEEGIVVVRFTVAPSGAAEAIALVESSGHLLLDRAALEALTRVHDLPAEAAGRRSIAILQYRTGGPGRDLEGARRLRMTAEQLRQRQAPALLSAADGR